MTSNYTCTTHDSFPFATEQEWKVLEKKDQLYTSFSSFLWLSTWWNHFGSAFKTRIVIVRENGRIVGIGPFISGSVCLKRIPILRTIAFVEGIATTYKDIIYGEKEQDAICQEILGHLRTSEIRWDMLSLWNIPEDSPTNTGLNEFCKKYNLRMVQPAGIKIPVIKLTKTFDEYLMGLKATVRRNIRNNMRRVFDHEAIAFNVISKPSIEDINRFIDLHQKLWNSRGKPGVFKNKDILAFYRDVLVKLADTGEHIMFEIQHSGKAIAMCSRFLYGNTMHSFLEGWDPEWKAFGLGKVIDILSIRYAIEKGMTEYDFSIGDYKYKYEYTDHFKTNKHYMIFRTKYAYSTYMTMECCANFAKKLIGRK